MCSKKRYNV